MRQSLFIGCAGVALMGFAEAGPAFAQVAQPAASAADDAVSNEIVVTAQKREESLSKVPISIAVLGGGQLDQASKEGALEILDTVPGLATRTAAQAGATQISIRGVTPNQAIIQGGPTVGFYLDSMPFALVRSGLAPDANVYDLARVEVLRGPQGTLYGASSLNGVVRVLTNDADPSGFEFKARAGVSDTKDGQTGFKGDMAVNLPIVADKLAIRAVVGYEDRAGWIDSPNRTDINGGKKGNVRIKVGARPSETLSVNLTYWHSRENLNGPDISDLSGNRAGDAPEFMRRGFDMYGASITNEFENFTLVSNTSYLKYHNNGALTLNNTPPYFLFDTNIRNRGFTQEILLNSTDDEPWRWSVGGLYRNARDNLYEVFAVVDTTDKSKSFAGFAQASRMFLDDRLELTGGLRYFEDKVTTIEGVPGALFPTVTAKFHKLTPKVSVTWRPDDATTIYATYGQGFRSGLGQFNRVYEISPSITPAGPDTLTNYEVGAKGRILGNALTYDAAAYFISWKNTQQSLLIQDPSRPGVFFPAILNSGKADGFGFDFNLTLRPAKGLAIGGSANFNGLRYRDDIMSGGIVLFPKGGQLNGSPKYTLGGWASYTQELSAGWMARFDGSVDYTARLLDRVISGGAVTTANSGRGIFLAGASVAVEAPEHWTIKAFVENLTNNRRPVSGYFAEFFPDWYAQLRPRTVGLQVEYEF